MIKGELATRVQRNQEGPLFRRVAETGAMRLVGEYCINTSGKG